MIVYDQPQLHESRGLSPHLCSQSGQRTWSEATSDSCPSCVVPGGLLSLHDEIALGYLDLRYSLWIPQPWDRSPFYSVAGLRRLEVHP